MKFSKKLILNGDLKSIISKACPQENLIFSAINYTDSSAKEFSAILIQDSLGNILSSKKIVSPDNSGIKLNDLILSDNNSIFFIGRKTDPTNRISALVLNMDLDGQIRWAKSYQSKDDLVLNSAIHFGNSLIICGSNPNKNQGLLIRISDNGSILSALKLHSSNNYDFNDISIYSKGFILSGSVEKDAALFQYPFKGDSIETYRFSSLGNINRLDQIMSQDLNRFYVSGYSDAHSTVAGDAIICKWNTGQPQNAQFKYIGVANDFEIQDASFDANSIITCLGKSEYYGNGIYNGFLCQLDSNLRLLNARVLQNNFSSELHAIVRPNINRLGFFGIRNDNTAINDLAYGLMDADSISLCEFQIANLDTGTFSPGISSAFFFFENVNLSVLPIPIQLTEFNLRNQNICEEGFCKTKLKIQWQNQKYCIDDTIHFNLEDSFPDMTWKLNGQLVSKKSGFSMIYDGDSIQLSAEVWDSLGCNGFDKINIHPKKYTFEIKGETDLCINNAEAWYHVIYDQTLQFETQLFNGEMVEKNGDSLRIIWENNDGHLLASLNDSSNCSLAKESLEISLDSGIIIKPVINVLSEDSLLELTSLDFSLQSIPEIQNQTFRLYKISRNISHYQTNLLENESKWIDPDYDPEAGYYIETENNCAFTLRSKTHKIINLKAENHSLKWTDYLGWPNLKTKYYLIRNGTLTEELISNDYPLKSYEEFESCFRIMAKNMESEYLSFSNKQCFEESIKLKLPNVITPNGDGVNDQFHIRNLQMFPSNTFRVYNRWGKLIFHRNNYDNTWPGNNIESGTYFYRLSVESKSGIKSYKGWIEVLK